MASCWVWVIFGALCGGSIAFFVLQRTIQKARRYDILCETQMRLQREAKPSQFSFPSEFNPMLDAIQRSLQQEAGHK